MTPIQQDPARRIRRIQRWLRSGSVESTSVHQWLHSGRRWPSTKIQWLAVKRYGECNRLFRAELGWLCGFTVDARNAWDRDIGYAEQTIAEQKARIEELEGKLSTLERARADSCDD